MASVSACGADFMKSRFRFGIVAEHAASMKPHATTAMSRLMIASRHAANPHTPKGLTRCLISLLPYDAPKCGADEVKYN
jgi:hypothetical protein